MDIKSTKSKADKIIAEINMQDRTQMSIDAFLKYEQLINELSQERIDFNKLRKYGCPSEFISCVFACKGIKPNATPQMCSKFWEDALTEDVHVDLGLEDTPLAQTASAKTENAKETVEEETEPIDYSDVLGVTQVTGANYFSTAAQSIKEQFSNQNKPQPKKEEKKSFFKKKEKHPPQPQISAYDKLKVLDLSPEQILEIFELLEWNTIKDFDLLKEVLTKYE